MKKTLCAIMAVCLMLAAASCSDMLETNDSSGGATKASVATTTATMDAATTQAPPQTTAAQTTAADETFLYETDAFSIRILPGWTLYEDTYFLAQDGTMFSVGSESLPEPYAVTDYVTAAFQTLVSQYEGIEVLREGVGQVGDYIGYVVLYTVPLEGTTYTIQQFYYVNGLTGYYIIHRSLDPSVHEEEIEAMTDTFAVK